MRRQPGAAGRVRSDQAAPEPLEPPARGTLDLGQAQKTASRTAWEALTACRTVCESVKRPLGGYPRQG